MGHVNSAKESSEEEQAIGNSNVASLAWAAAAIAWAIVVYLIEREKQRTLVALARLEMETKKQTPS